MFLDILELGIEKNCFDYVVSDSCKNGLKCPYIYILRKKNLKPHIFLDILECGLQDKKIL